MPGGHPDYQNYASWRGPVYLAETTTIPSGTTITIDEYVTNYASIYLFVLPTGNGEVVTCTFYTDSSKVAALNFYQWNVSIFGALCAVIPVLGNFVEITVHNAGPNPDTPQIGIVPLNIAHAAITYPIPVNRIARDGLSIPLSSSQTFRLPYLGEGPASLFTRPHSAGGDLSWDVWETDQTGALVGRVCTSDNAANASVQQFQAHAAPLAVVVTNASATTARIGDFCLALPGR